MLDQNIVNLAKAIRQQESGGNFNQKGASGEFGAYQYTKDTWNKWAGQYLGNANAPLTPENQNKVAYLKIKDWKDQGLQPSQIAAAWNAGEDKLKNDAWKSNVGINDKGVKYDTPNYVASVGKYFQDYSKNTPKQAGGTLNMQPKADMAGLNPQNAVQPPQQGFMSKLGQIGYDVGKNIVGGVLQPAAQLGATAIAGAITPIEKGITMAAGKNIPTSDIYNRARQVVGGEFKAPNALGSEYNAVPQNITTPQGLETTAGDIIQTGAAAYAPTTIKGMALAGGAFGLGSGLSSNDNLMSIAGKTAVGTTLGAGLGVIGKAFTPEAKAFEKDAIKAFPIMKAETKNVSGKVNNIYNAFSDIVKNKESTGLVDEAGQAKLPSNFSETQQVADARKAQIYKDYTAKLAGADKQKFTEGINGELTKIKEDITARLSSTFNTAKKQALNNKLGEINSILKKAELDPTAIQTYIEDLNTEAKPLYTGNATPKAVEAANLSSKLRSVLDNSIDKVGGEGYQDLRNLYGSYKALDSQIASMAKKEINNIPGFFQKATNLGLTMEAVNSLLRADPVGFLTTLGIKGGQKLYEHFNSPTKALNNLFDRIEGGYKLPLKSIKSANAQPIANPPTSASKSIIPNTLPQSGK